MANIRKFTAGLLKYPLNDGNFIPALGLGVYNCSKDDVRGTEKAVSVALKHGYPMIDTAEVYEYVQFFCTFVSCLVLCR